jgi:hypothetical protein
VACVSLLSDKIDSTDSIWNWQVRQKDLRAHCAIAIGKKSENLFEKWKRHPILGGVSITGLSRVERLLSARTGHRLILVGCARLALDSSVCPLCLAVDFGRCPNHHWHPQYSNLYAKVIVV